MAPPVAKAIKKHGGSDASVLKQVVTSPTYGAPPRQTLPKLEHEASPSQPRGVGTKLGKALGASAGSEFADAGHGRLLGLLLIALAILAAAVAFRVARRRRPA